MHSESLLCVIEISSSLKALFHQSWRRQSSSYQASGCIFGWFFGFLKIK